MPNVFEPTTKAHELPVENSTRKYRGSNAALIEHCKARTKMALLRLVTVGLFLHTVTWD